MGTAVSSVVVTAKQQGAVDYSRYISQRGLDHLKVKLPNLRDQIEVVKLTISDLAREREFTARYDELRRLGRLEADADEIEHVLRDPIVIDDCAEYQELPEGEIWLGCGVSYVDNVGPAYVALLNKLEREVPHHHQPAEGCEDEAVSCGCSADYLQALLGHRVGDEFTCTVNGKTQKLKILAVTQLLGC